MKILETKKLAIPEIKVIKYGHFSDQRGYFTEQFRKSQFAEFDFFQGFEFKQTNESFSKKNVIRGLHFQWDPYMGKLVRTVSGLMVDLVLDIRKNSPTFGKAIAYKMPYDAKSREWIWVPPGFAHGNFYVEDSVIEYFCTGEYSPESEAGISPIAEDIDWSLCDPELKKLFDQVKANVIMSDKDRDGLTVATWEKDARSEKFM